MKIAITGATGSLGSHLVRHFSSRGHEIIALGRSKKPPSALLDAVSEYIRADISTTVPRLEVDCCIHSAALASDRGLYERFYQVNVEGTERVFEAVRTPLFIHISSASIYDFSGHPIREDQVDPDAILSNYGKTKWLAESFLQKQSQRRRSIVSLRPRAIYGTHDRVLLPRILKLVRNNKIIIPGDGMIPISMTHVSNLITGIERVIEQQPKGFHAYNIADERTYLLREVIEQVIFGLHGKILPVKEIPIRWIKSFVKMADSLKIPISYSAQSIAYVTESMVLDLTKIKKQLQYEAITDFDLELANILDWGNHIGIKKIRKAAANLPWTG
ncbi:MAG: NAD(P)-dependent oxidoreductase [Bacteroidota bacterium]